MLNPLLTINGLKTYFFTEKGVVKAIDGINLEIGQHETLGLVGESGSGKSVTALSIMRLVPHPGRIVEGQVLLEGDDLLKKTKEDMIQVRGCRMSMIFQDPTSSLNPVLNVGEQIGEVIRLHGRTEDESDTRKRIIEILEEVGIPDASTRHRHYPHQLSGGMRQRVMIAMALSCNPELLIADEPTTNLDVTIQAQILDLMKQLKKDFGSSILLITHDLGVIAEMCDRVAVMYAGSIMEYSNVTEIFENHEHPYTEALLDSIPRIDISKKRLRTIPGRVPELIDPPKGCRFHPRCSYAKEICSKQRPELIEINPGHYVSCYLKWDKGLQ